MRNTQPFSQMLLLSLTMGLIVSCHHSEEKEMDAVDSAIVDAGFPDEDGCTPVMEFMMFLHNLCTDRAYQLAHVKFPAGTLTYPLNDSVPYTVEYWRMLKLTDFVISRDSGDFGNGIEPVMTGGFDWRDDEHICFTSQLTPANLYLMVNFERQEGVWRVVKADYHNSDAVTVEDCIEMAKGYKEDFAKQDADDFVPCKCEGVPGRFPQASERKLETNDLKGLHRKDLAIVRNEILARHGYDFHDNQEMLDYFLQQPWYMPLFLNVDKVLTPLEKSNIRFVKEFEK
jgi:hypothetical protein